MKRLNRKYKKLMRRVQKEKCGRVFNDLNRLKMETAKYLETRVF